MIVRLHLTITGAVQGVGFRPFVYGLAKESGLVGWVNNSSQGVFVEVEGDPWVLQQFIQDIEDKKPPQAFISDLTAEWLAPSGYQDFEIRPSVGGEKTAVVLPDLATCSACLAEILDPHNRRYRYPFTNCTHCGPRYTIIKALPYDRQNTSMGEFIMCPDCQQEYEDPLNRRFHAQPNACPKCGPQLALWKPDGKVITEGDEALKQAAEAIREGKVLALKGLGGFLLLVDARKAEAVALLRSRKHRPHKPLGLMYPSLELVQQDCQVSNLAELVLRSPAAPIVLLEKQPEVNLAANIAPNQNYFGIMLPYTPLHYLLMAELAFPVVATSGNLSDEPICIDEHEALDRLALIADLYLVHNRPIVRPVDDSVVKFIAGKPIILRRARGYAPLPITISVKTSQKILAVGAHFKNTIGIGINNQVFLSQHIGDLETHQALSAFETVIESFQTLYEFQPEVIACDAHPDYLSTQYAQSRHIPIVYVQHHQAHVLATMAEHNLLGQPVLGLAWDGTGYGLDGTIWGGEWFSVDDRLSCQRVAHFRPFALLGGDAAIRQPKRIALGLLLAIFGESLDQVLTSCPWVGQNFSPTQLSWLVQMFRQRINAPMTSSVGRLFDAVAALINLCEEVSYEGQAAVQLEALTGKIKTKESYPISFSNQMPFVINWQQIILGILNDLDCQTSTSVIAVKFHQTLAEIILKIAQQIGIKNLVFSGGCFQNKYLVEISQERLQEAGFQLYFSEKIPPNDGSIALGQIIAASRKIN